MQNSDLADGRPPIPAKLRARFEQAGGRFTSYRPLLALWEVLEGRPYEGTRAQRKKLEAHHFGDLMHSSVGAYNAALAEVLCSRKPRRPSRDSGRRRARLLAGVDGVVTAGVATRFPALLDPCAAIDGAEHYEDVIGRVECDTVLRSAHLGVLGALGGIYSRREDKKIAQAGLVEIDGRINVSARMLHELASHGRPTGRRLKRIDGILRDLHRATFSGDVRKDTSKVEDEADWRDKELRANPVERVERWVEGASGPELCPIDDPRPTAKVALPYVVTLDSHYLTQLSGDSRDLVFFTFSVWRRLSRTARRVYLFLQGEHGKFVGGRGRRGITFYSSEKLLRQLGWRDMSRTASHSDSLYLALLEIMQVDQRYEFVYNPRQKNATRFHTFAMRFSASAKSGLRESAPWRRLSRQWFNAERKDETRNRDWLLRRADLSARVGMPHPLLT